MNTGLNIMYVGPLVEGGTCRMRMRALQELGHRLVPVDILPPEAAMEMMRPHNRLMRKLGLQPDLVGANERILASAQEEQIDIVWVDKGLTIKPSTIEQIKQLCRLTVVISYSPDDMVQPHNQSAAYLASVPLYDIHFTTKSFNVYELYSMGAKRVCFVNNGFDPHTHRPVAVTAEEKYTYGGRVGFIGDFERDRAEQLVELANHGVPVRVWGTNWHKWMNPHPNLVLERRPLWGEEYAKAICSFEVNLCFLRKINRDRQTTRTVEIPACGAFMLGERTDEQSRLFSEGKEADYFSTTRELIEKTDFYLTHADTRTSIACAGRERCLSSGYDYQHRMQWMLDQVIK